MSITKKSRMAQMSASPISESQSILYDVLRPVVRILRLSGYTEEMIRSALNRACRRYARSPVRGAWLESTHGLGLDRARVITLMNVLRVWSQNPEFVDEKGQPKPVTLGDGPGSFRALLRSAKCNLAISRAVEQLKALGSVQLCDRGTRMRLLSNVLIVVAGNRFVVAPSIDAIRRFAETIEHNLCAGSRPGEGRIHRWAACEALDASQLEEIQRYVRSNGQIFLEALDDKLSSSKLRRSRRRAISYGVGFYVFTDRPPRNRRRRSKRRKG